MINIAPVTLAKCAANYRHTSLLPHTSLSAKQRISCKERGCKNLTLTWTKSDKFINKRTSLKVNYSSTYMSYVFVTARHDLHIQ